MLDVLIEMANQRLQEQFRRRCAEPRAVVPIPTLPFARKGRNQFIRPVGMGVGYGCGGGWDDTSRVYRREREAVNFPSQVCYAAIERCHQLECFHESVARRRGRRKLSRPYPRSSADAHL